MRWALREFHLGGAVHLYWFGSRYLFVLHVQRQRVGNCIAAHHITESQPGQKFVKAEEW